MHPALALAAATLLAAPFSAPLTGSGAGADVHRLRQCEAIAPFQLSCGFSIVPSANHNSTVTVLHEAVFSGILQIVAEQQGSAIWNVTCITPLGFRNTGVGVCLADDPDPPAFQGGVTMNMSITVDTYGAGTFGVRIVY